MGKEKEIRLLYSRKIRSKSTKTGNHQCVLETTRSIYLKFRVQGDIEKEANREVG